MSILTSEYSVSSGVVARTFYDSGGGFLGTGKARTVVYLSEVELENIASNLEISVGDIESIFMIFENPNDASIKAIRLNKFGNESGFRGNISGEVGDETLVEFEEKARIVQVTGGSAYLLYEGITLTSPEIFQFLQEDENGDIDVSILGLALNWASMTQTDTLLADVPTAYDDFGWSVAIDGDYAVVGAYREDTAANSAGAAFVFIRSGSTWTEQQKLTASDAAAYDQFGYSVAISGDTLIVGATDKNGLQGAAYVFTRSGVTWTEQQKLTASDGQSNDEFGTAVSIDGETVMVGAPLEDGGDEDPLSDAGAVYIFTRSGVIWSQQQKLVADDAGDLSRFGAAVSIDGDDAIIGAYMSEVGAYANAGAAYVFTRSGGIWSQQQKLVADDAANLTSFGWSVGIDRDSVVVGAKAAKTSGIAYGAAYVFTRSGVTWTQQQKFKAINSQLNDQFGYSVAIYGDNIAVGADFEDGGPGDPKSNAGAAYMFTRSGTTWTEQKELLNDEVSCRFGISVSLYGKTVIIGSVYDDIGITDGGAALTFEV